MKLDALPSPGALGNGLRLQSETIKAISYVQVVASLKAGKTPQAAKLDAFFVAARNAIATFIDAVVPTVSTRTVSPAYGADRIVLTHSEGLDQSKVPPVSAFAITGTVRTVTAVYIEGPRVILVVSAPFAAGNAINVAYTQPGAATNLRDQSGNLVASYAAAAVTNTLV